MDVRANVGGGRVVLVGVTTGALLSVAPVSYTHLTLPTNREV